MNPSNPSTRPNFSLSNQPLTVISITPCDIDSSLRWYLPVRDGSGAMATIIIENQAHHLRVYQNHYNDNFIERENLFHHSFGFGENAVVRHCAIAILLDHIFSFPPQLLLLWALLDLNVEATEAALDAGAELDRPLLNEIYALDLVSLAVTTRTESTLRFFGEDERDDAWGQDYQRMDGSDYVDRATRIRSMLRSAGAGDFASFRKAIQKGDFRLAKARLIAGVPIDAQAPDGLTPLLSAIFKHDLAALRWLIRESADCSIHALIPDYLGTTPPECFRTPWAGSASISPLTAACAADFPDGFHSLLAEAAFHFSETDYQEVMTHPHAPAWAKDALLDGGFANPTSPIDTKPSTEDVRLLKLFDKMKSDESSNDNVPPRLRAVFLSHFSDGQPAIDWAEQHAPELLDAQQGDPMACKDLIERWLNESGADPSRLLMDAVAANDPSLVEALLPADPDTMGHALLLAMTHANSLTRECYDFFLDRGCITDDIRGKGLPEGYLEIAESIVHLLRSHEARDFTRLASAARKGDLEAMLWEIAEGTPVNFTCDGWGSPLLAAITGGHLAAVRALLSEGADPNLAFNPDSGWQDTLHLPVVTAVRHGNADILKALLKAGADLRCPQMSKSGIFENGIPSREIAEILFHQPLPLLRNIMGATCAHLLDVETLRLCQDLIPAAVWNARDTKGQTPAMKAISGESWAILFLLSAGASPNVYSSIDSFMTSLCLPDDLKPIALTPLHAAIVSRHVILIESLLEAGGSFKPPAFTLAEDRSLESCQRLRDILDGFEPADLPQWERDPWRRTFAEDQEFELRFSFSQPSGSPRFNQDELKLLSHYLAEDPSRAAHHRDLIIPMSCMDLAKLVDSPLITEMVKCGGKLRAVTFFAFMREEIAQTISEYQIILRQLEDPEIPKPFIFPYMKEMRRLELTLLHRIWKETGTVPSTDLIRNAAMECLRYASAEFYEGFAEAIAHAEETGEASVEDLCSVLAENLNPGSTIDLGKFFSNAIGKLRSLETLCKH